MVKLLDIAWLGGIVDGEGYIGHTSRTPIITVTMTDKDVIERVASLLKRPWYKKKPNEWSDKYTVSICGSAAVEWMFTLYTFLSNRRKNKVNEITNIWKGQHSYFHKDTFKCGHPKSSSNSYHRVGKSSICRICDLARRKKTKKGW